MKTGIFIVITLINSLLKERTNKAIKLQIYTVIIVDETFVFYTRRTLDFKYFIGAAKKGPNGIWTRVDDWLNTIEHGCDGEFDEQMVYFPCVLDTGSKIFLFYTGNGYGKEGIGYAELIKK